MKIVSRTRRFITASLVFSGLVASVSHAQTVNVNGTACAAATVTFGNGSININTGGCGTTVVTPPPVSSSPPTISGLSVTSGAQGTVFTINGGNLGGAEVFFGAVKANVASNTGSQIVVSVPSVSAGTATISVTTSAGTSTTTFNVTAAPPPAAPSITLVSPASGSVGTLVTITGSGLSGATVTIGGIAATITTSSASSISTTVPANASTGGIVVTTSVASTASFPFAVTVSTPGASEVSIEGITLPNPSKRPSGISGPPQHGGTRGAGTEINAYAMPPSRCKTTPALARSWQHNIDLEEYKNRNALDYFVMGANEALSYKFTVGDKDASGGFAYNDASFSGGAIRPVFISITTAPCDFDVSKISGATRDACYQTGLNGMGLAWANITGPLPVSYCRLVKGQTYYMNLRFQDARPAGEGGSPTSDSCGSGSCGGVLQIN